VSISDGRSKSMGLFHQQSAIGNQQFVMRAYA
jgi:hypothetical protein